MTSNLSTSRISNSKVQSTFTNRTLLAEISILAVHHRYVKVIDNNERIETTYTVASAVGCRIVR
jgi:hypothetical protein